MSPFSYRRIVIIGTTSSGKSTLAKKLAEKIHAEHIELDALHWEPNWVEAPDDVMRERVAKALQSETWVVAGNYQQMRDLIWSKAQAIIWLDYSFPIVFWRLLTRTIRRVVTKEKLFAGNVEDAWMHLKLWSENSLFHWLFKTYWRRKREYPLLFSMPEHQHIKVFRFKTQAETDEWLNQI